MHCMYVIHIYIYTNITYHISVCLGGYDSWLQQLASVGLKLPVKENILDIPGPLPREDL